MVSGAELSRRRILGVGRPRPEGLRVDPRGVEKRCEAIRSARCPTSGQAGVLDVDALHASLIVVTT